MVRYATYKRLGLGAAVHYSFWCATLALGLATALCAQSVTSGSVAVPLEISAVAGGGASPLGANPEPPTQIQLQLPSSVARDRAGNLYFADTGHNEIDEIQAASGNATVIAGGGATVPSSAPVPATSASLSHPSVAVDSAGDVFIADAGHGLVEEVAAGSGQIAVIAGGGATP